MSMFEDARRNAGSRLGAMGGGPEYAEMNGDEGKVPMGEVNYRPAEGPEMSCSTCAHFDGAGSCEVVAGEIDPRGVSDAFAPREQAQQVPPEVALMQQAPQGPPQ